MQTVGVKRYYGPLAIRVSQNARKKQRRHSNPHQRNIRERGGCWGNGIVWGFF